MPYFRWVIALLAGLFLPAAAGAELTARQLLLVVNPAVPQGVTLATEYARLRGVPPEQIIQLTLPDGDEISIDDYETRLADPLRMHLRSASYGPNIKCIVTFIGVPYRIPPRSKTNIASVAGELALLNTQLAQLRPRLESAAGLVERMAVELDATFVPAAGQDPVSRVRIAADRAGRALQQLPDVAQRSRHEQTLAGILAEARKPIELTEPTALDVPATQRAEIGAQMRAGAIRAFDPIARRLLRDDSRRLGALVFYQVLDAQRDYLTNEQTDAAVDSELACLKWNVYRRSLWQGNPLRFDAERGALPETLMTARFDGYLVPTITQRLKDAIEVEKTGLRGQIVIDSRNIPARKADGSTDGFGVYDETLRRLRDFLAGAGVTLPVTFDANEQLIPAGSLKDIAVYCGWYNPVQVHLPGSFAQGAVGFHIASYTAVGLRGYGGGNWTPEMLTAGTVHTLGAVSEPYLLAFPNADEFVPLVLTGKLTMAEVYWKTAPTTSWKIVVIGDPLYNPFRAAPALKPEALPPGLQRALSGP